MTAIWWVRRDLRLRDNPALLAAAERGEVLAVFVLDPALWGPSGDPRRAYLLDSLASLEDRLDGRLLVLPGEPTQVLPALARALEVAEVHVAADLAPHGRLRDRAVADALGAVRLVATGSPYAVAPGRVRKGDGDPYRVFTPFHRAWLDHGWRAPAGTASQVRWVDPDAALAASGLHRGASPVRPDVVVPAAGEDAATERWEEFRDDGLADYGDGRDRPDRAGTSRLSVALKWGEVHPRTLLADLARVPEPARAGAAIFRSELAWREFFADVLWHTPASARTSLRPAVAEDSWASGPEAERAFDAWTAGRTGFPFVDAGMRQLAETGWMHGRVRMVTASFLVKDLHVPWQRGARHFMLTLLDGDLASNQHNWQWVAGTGMDAAPFFRIFNPITQGKKFDPDGAYVRRWVPELAHVPGAKVHEPWTLATAPPGYPERIVDHAVEREVALDAHRRR